MDAIALLIDENVPESVTRFLRERGHDVRLVREILPAGSPDPVVAVVGDDLGAVVVTWNHKDFKKLVARVPAGSQKRLRRLGRINFRCHEAKGRKRLEEMIEWVEFEYAQVQKKKDKRLMIEIGETYFRVIR